MKETKYLTSNGVQMNIFEEGIPMRRTKDTKKKGTLAIYRCSDKVCGARAEVDIDERPLEDGSFKKGTWRQTNPHTCGGVAAAQKKAVSNDFSSKTNAPKGQLRLGLGGGYLRQFCAGF